MFPYPGRLPRASYEKHVMTRLAAVFVALSLMFPPNAWAAQKKRTEPAKKSQVRKKQRPVPAPRAVPVSGVEPAEPMAAPAVAQDAPKSGQKPAQQQKPASEQQPAAQQGDDMDFDLLEEPLDSAAAAQVDPELDKRIRRRRTMLKLHQGIGFAMSASLLTTTVLGQLQFNDSFRGGGDDRNLLGLHRGFAIGTAALFATGGLLGLLAPEPFEKEFQWDTVTFHKMFMALATAGMLAQIILGVMATDRYGRLSETNFATAHQVVGFTTMGAVSAGVLMLFF